MGHAILLPRTNSLRAFILSLAHIAPIASATVPCQCAMSFRMLLLAVLSLVGSTTAQMQAVATYNVPFMPWEVMGPVKL